VGQRTEYFCDVCSASLGTQETGRDVDLRNRYEVEIGFAYEFPEKDDSNLELSLELCQICTESLSLAIEEWRNTFEAKMNGSGSQDE